MPVQSEKQRRFMYASLAGKTDVPPSVAKKFVGPKAHSQGGAIKESEMKLKFDKESGGGSSVMPGRVGGAPGLKYTYKGNIFAKGGEAKESPAMVKKEVSFMKKKGAPAAMIKHEKAEAKGYAKGGGIESKGKTKGNTIKMMRGGSCG